jgi:hypothetical protein
MTAQWLHQQGVETPSDEYNADSTKICGRNHFFWCQNTPGSRFSLVINTQWSRDFLLLLGKSNFFSETSSDAGIK